MPLSTVSRRFLLPLLALFACATSLCAQQTPTDDSLDYFPYRAGDRWRLLRDNIPDYPPEDYIVTSESVDTAGSIHLWGIDMRIDTSGDVYGTASEDFRELRYKLRAKVGDRWRQKSDNSDSALPFYVTCVGIGQMNVFGQTRRVKVFNFWYDASAGGLPDSMWYATHWLASGIGIIAEYYEPDAFFYTSGAVIGGVAYGDMVAGVQEASTGARPIVAPNPFAEQTTLTYHLDTREHVRLTICDPLGRVVAVPVDETQERGEHTAVIDGANLQEGSYFYRFRTPSRSFTGTLVRHS